MSDHALKCSKCGKSVSTAVPLETIVRAWIECPECISSAPDLLEALEGPEGEPWIIDLLEQVSKESYKIHMDALKNSEGLIGHLGMECRSRWCDEMIEKIKKALARAKG